MLNEIFIGNQIQSARKEQELSQAQFAQKLCVSPQAVSKWERGESMPDIITLSQIAQILKKDVSFFISNPPQADTQAAQDKEPAIIDEFEIPFQSENTQSQSDNTQSQSKEGNPDKDQESYSQPSFNMSLSSWRDADFSGLKNIGEKFNCSNVNNCKFKGSDLAGTRFNANNIKDSDFSLANLEYSAFRASNIVGNRFDGGKLINTKFYTSNIKNCSLVGSDMTRAELKSSLIQGCDFTGARLEGARLKLCNISKTNFDNTIFVATDFDCCHFGGITISQDMTQCSLISCTFKNTLFKNVIFKNCFFKGGDILNKQLSKVRFENCKADKLSYEFLKASKADLSNIQLID